MQTPRTASGTVLLLVDLQEWIVDLPLVPRAGAEIVQECRRLLDICNSVGIPMVPVRHLRTDGADGGAGAAANRIVPQITPVDEKLLLTKDSLDAFDGTVADGRGLEEVLRRELAADSVIVAGIATTHGVSATALSAVRRGFRTTVVSDATGAVDIGEHEAALASLAAAGVEVTSVSSLSQSLAATDH